MPSTTEDQARFMAACAHGAGYESCPPQKVSHEFNQADKGTSMLHRAMQHRVKRPMGGPVNMNTLPPQLLAALQARAAPNLAAARPAPTAMPGANPFANMPPMAGGPVATPTMPVQGMQPPHPAMATASQGMPMSGGAPPMPARPPMGPGPSPLASLHPSMAGPIGPPAGGMQRPNFGMNRPMPGMMMRARGGMIPPGMPPESPLPQRTSPLSSLIGGGMAGMHGGPGLAPHMRKPRIPLPGALRNINQTINHARGRLNQIGPV